STRMMQRSVGCEVRAGRVARMHHGIAMLQMRMAGRIMSTRTFVRSGMREASRGHCNQSGTAKREREGIGIHVVLLLYTRREQRTAARVVPPSVAARGKHHFDGVVPPTIAAMRASSAPVVEHTTGAVPNAIGVAVAWIRVATSVPPSGVALRRDTTLMLIEYTSAFALPLPPEPQSSYFDMR